MLASLMAAVRPEFRADELVFDPADQVFGGPKLCLVTGCGRTARDHGLCKAHRSRRAAAGRPAVEAFAASADSRWRRQVPLAGCQAPGCRYGISRRKGLCRRHGYAWERDGMPDLRQWASGLPAAAAGDQAECLVSGCRLWADPGTELCTWHGRAWKSRGRPAVRESAASWNAVDLVPGNERIFLGALPAQLKL